MALSFQDLRLSSSLLSSLHELGYETPTPIQAESIPVLLDGRDISAQAQTGTGKTAAFALPILSRIELAKKEPQAIIITPTRELAIQVAEAFQSYAKHLKGFHVAPIYGGQDYQVQLRALKRGVHVVVGTPGRVMDHFRRGSLSAQTVKTVVLDEADEMLKMGFIDDVEWILQQIPHEHQTALFSATMPSSIQTIAKRYLNDPERIQIKPTTQNVGTIEQSYISLARNQKMDVLTRYLEIENVTAAIIFASTKNCSQEVADKLLARGYGAAALNGDMNQSMREKVIGQIKKGSIDIIVATDVAARGIDVDRITHVINYDIPYDAESYVHRIGRTGRAGRAGKALMFVTSRERYLLKDIERSIKQKIQQIEPPTIAEMKEKRTEALTEKVINIIAKSKKLGPYQQLVLDIMAKSNDEPVDIAAAVMYLMEQANPMPTEEIQAAKPEFERKHRGKPKRFRGKPSGGRSESRSRPSGGRSEGRGKRSFKDSKDGYGGKRKTFKSNAPKGRAKSRSRAN
ncbi:MAG: DEAD/DEAH box helicase [Legionellales bacterium]|nr:DEAD/DEAH box helicase [Legionellales bacterium]|tara:strand:+ start:979 stop:2523 length:1545 start_codon:yes stop_codon:yes gene_type:complete